ncbi:MAG: hypothetical protein JW807_02700 [Spirochaetes bacterium]|nr:hypothetical protein [Spirochaetota bacterium]
MKTRLLTTAIAFVILATPGTLAAKNVRTVKAIAFKGLKLLSKYDIVRGARYRATEAGIVIDLDSLEKAIERNGFIDSYRIDEEKGNLVVTVVERTPELIVVVPGEDGSVLYELDAERQVISRNDVHTARIPVIYLSVGYAPDGSSASRAGRLFVLLDRVKKTNPAVYRELSEIHQAGRWIRVMLRGRKTEFTMKPDEASFIRLKYIIGYCDSVEQYPDEINLSGNAVIVR